MTTHRISEETVVLGAGDLMNEAHILRAFDRRRRALAITLCGHHGAFAGYDVLELSRRLHTSDRAVIEAVVLQNRGERHQVEYRAFVSQDRPGVGGSATPPLVRAIGWTLTHGGPTSTAT